MTRTLDFPPELENRLQVLAAQRGTSVEAFVLQAVEVAATEPNPLRDALALLTDLTPIMRAGTANGGAPFDAAAELDTMREERFADAR